MKSFNKFKEKFLALTLATALVFSGLPLEGRSEERGFIGSLAQASEEKSFAYSEDFSGFTTSGNGYVYDTVFQGPSNGISWEINGGRSQDGKLELRNKSSDNAYVKATFANGLSSIKLTLSKAESNTQERSLSLYVDGYLAGTIEVPSDNDDLVSREFPINKKGPVTILLKRDNPDKNGRQVYVNKIEWNDFGTEGPSEPDPEEGDDPQSSGEVLSISDARKKAKGEEATTTGVITAISGGNYFLEDDEAGIDLYDKNRKLSYIKVGDEVKVKGRRDDFNGLVELVPESFEIVSEGRALPFTEVSISDYLADPTKYESRRLKFTGVTIGKKTGRNTEISQDGVKVNVYDLPSGNFKEGSVADIIAIGSTFNGNPQLKVFDVKDIRITKEGNGDTIGGELVKINKIQGDTLQSPMVGQKVRTRGVVIAKSEDYFNQGYYIHSLKEDCDDDPNTSEGLFVETKYKGAERGDIVEVEGTVEERKMMTTFDHQFTVTGLTSAYVTNENKKLSEAELDDFVVELHAGNVPEAVSKDEYKEEDHGEHKIDKTASAIDFYESLENMPVKVSNGEIVAATERYGDITVLPDKGEGLGYARTKKGGLKYASYENSYPAKITVSDKIIPITSNKEWKDPNFNPYPGKYFDGDIEGVLVYAFSDYKLLNYKPLPKLKGEGHGPDGPTKLVTDDNSLTLASYNLENFNAAESGNRAERFAGQIVGKLLAPDLIGLNEVQDNNGQQAGSPAADQTIAKLLNPINSKSGKVYKAVNIDPPRANQDGGAPNGNIRPVFLYDTNKLKLVEGEEGLASKPEDLLGDEGGKLVLKTNPTRYGDGISAFEATRKPLIAQFEILQGPAEGEKLIAINNHLSSKNGDEPIFGPSQPANRKSEGKRKSQAEALGALVKEILSIDPQANIVLMGDLNDYEFSETLKTIEKTGMKNVGEKLEEGERYSYIYQGYSQELDHILLSPALYEKIAGADVLNINSEFSVKDGFTSDHDPLLAKVSFDKEAPVVVKYQVKFVLPEGALSQDINLLSQEIEKGKKLTSVPKVTPSKWKVFKGWKANKDFAGKKAGDLLTEEDIKAGDIKEDITFTAMVEDESSPGDDQEGDLEKKKKEAKEDIDKLSDLSDTKKTSYKDEIEKAQSESDIEKILAAAKKANADAGRPQEPEDNLAEKKSEAKREIDKLKKLSPGARDSYKGKIDQAKSLGAIEEILEEAEKENKGKAPSQPNPPSPSRPGHSSGVGQEAGGKSKADEDKAKAQKAEAIEKLRISYREVRVSKASLENLKKLAPNLVGKKKSLYDDLLAKADQRLDITGETLEALTGEDLEKAILGDIDPKSPRGRLTLSSLDLEVSKESLDNLKLFAPNLVRANQKEFDAIYKKLEERLEKTNHAIKALK